VIIATTYTVGGKVLEKRCEYNMLSRC